MLLSDDEIKRCLYNSGDPDGLIEFARAVEAAILAKLASAELPEPLVWDYYDFEGWRPRVMVDDDVCETYTADQLRQAYAQGAAAQLAEKPFGFVRSSQWHFGHVACDESDEGAFALYTRREAK